MTLKCVASIYDIYYKMVERETKILRDKKSRRIIKMDRNKANNDKYTYNIVDTNQPSAEMDYESKLPF